MNSNRIVVALVLAASLSVLVGCGPDAREPFVGIYNASGVRTAEGQSGTTTSGLLEVSRVKDDPQSVRVRALGSPSNCDFTATIDAKTSTKLNLQPRLCPVVSSGYAVELVSGTFVVSGSQKTLTLSMRETSGGKTMITETRLNAEALKTDKNEALLPCAAETCGSLTSTLKTTTPDSTSIGSVVIDDVQGGVLVQTWFMVGPGSGDSGSTTPSGKPTIELAVGGCTGAASAQLVEGPTFVTGRTVAELKESLFAVRVTLSGQSSPALCSTLR
jgi:hypothetical protein